MIKRCCIRHLQRLRSDRWCMERKCFQPGVSSVIFSRLLRGSWRLFSLRIHARENYADVMAKPYSRGSKRQLAFLFRVHNTWHKVLCWKLWYKWSSKFTTASAEMTGGGGGGVRRSEEGRRLEFPTWPITGREQRPLSPPPKLQNSTWLSGRSSSLKRVCVCILYLIFLM